MPMQPPGDVRSSTVSTLAEAAAMLDITEPVVAVFPRRHIDDLDDLCLAAIAHQLPCTDDLVRCGKSCARMRAACLHELERRARGLLQYAGMHETLPVGVELESGRGEGSASRPYAVADVVGLAATYAGGWAALLAGRELRLETSSPEPATSADYAPPEGAEPAAEEEEESYTPVAPSTAAALVIWDVVKITTREMSPAECEERARAAQTTDDLILVGLQNKPELNGARVLWTGRAAGHGRVSVRHGGVGPEASTVLAVRPANLRLRERCTVWSGVLPLLDQLNQIGCYVHGARLGGGCAMFPRYEWGARRFPGGGRAWRHVFADGSRGDLFQLSGDVSDESTAWCVRVSVVAPGCTETLVDAMHFEPTQLRQLAVAEPDHDLLPEATHIEPHGAATFVSRGVRRRRAADGQFLRSTMPPEARPLPDGPRGSGPVGDATASETADHHQPAAAEEAEEEAEEEEEDEATGIFGLTYPCDNSTDDRHAHYFRAYVWMQVLMDSEGDASGCAYHVDVDLTREDRLWAIDIARGNKAPRLTERR